MLLYFLGTRGTVPSSGQGTMSFIVDNKFVFDICPEFVHSMTKLTDCWKNSSNSEIQHLQSLYGRPTFSTIEHIFISHLHLDHWGGLRHLLTRAIMFELDMRIQKKKPIHVYIPHQATNLFDSNLQILFDSNKSLINGGEFLLNYLAIELGGEIEKIVKIHTVKPDDPPIKVDNYQISARYNKHMQGSMGYKVEYNEWKLNEEKRKKSGIPKGKQLGQLQRNGHLSYNGKEFHRENLFDTKTVRFGYSGDTPFDPEFIQWFNDVQILVHESTYLEHDPTHHSDVHSVFTDLKEEIPKLKELKVFLPAHVSQRYTWDEITAYCKENEKNFPKILLHPPKARDIIHFKEGNSQIYHLPDNSKW
jgi:ribonuclease Z